MRSVKFLPAGLVALIGLGALAQAPQPLSPPIAVERADDDATRPVAAQPQPQPATSPQLTAQDVNAWLDGYMPYAIADGDIAGAVVVVVRDGRILSQRGYGYADIARRTPVNPARTLFRPGSISKLFTWTAVMQQVEQGRVDLDADVNRYLDFEIPPRDGQPVTMRHLMTHTAGFEEQAKSLIGFERKAVPDYATLLKQWVPERIYAAGTTPAYSNYATSLAGYIVERVSGEPFDAYIQRHILTPLNMTHSTFEQPLPERLQPLMATGYARASGDVVRFEFVGAAPAGALSASGEDMGRFMIAHLNQGAGLMRPETARMMHRTPYELQPRLNRMMLGFYEADINGRDVIAHGGDTVGFHSDLHLFINDNVGIYISMSSTGRDGAAGNIRTALIESFADRYFPAPRDTRRVPAETAREHAGMLTGNWSNSRRSASSFMNIAELLGQVTVGVDEEGRPVVPLATGLNGQPRQWVEVEPFVWQDLNSHERLAAHVVDGQAVRFNMSFLSPFMVFERTPWYKSSALLNPLLIAALLVLLLTVILWPVRALVRRSYGAQFELEGDARRAHFLTRITALLMLLTVVGWLAAFTMMTEDLTNLGPSFDPVIIFLQILTLISILGGFLVLAWNLWVTWKGKRRWPAKTWSLLLLLAGFVLLWVGFAFNLIGFGTDY